jgi:MoaA/NifB/PqqE/SkfB family radical SAM enzyme
MLYKKIKKNILNHPKTLKAVKFLIFNRFISNSLLYKNLVMKKVRRIACENKEFKESIFIETALTCNSRCIFCGHYNEVMSGIMPMELFKKIIDECFEFGINNICLGIYGEIFTDKDIFEKIGYLRKYNMTYGTITNASLLSPQVTDRLFEIGGMTFISFSVNGFSADVYEKTMVGLKRDVTYKNILYFLKKKEELKADNLEVTISAVETNINKKDFRDFFHFWKKQKGVSTVQSGELIDRMGREKEYDGKIGKLGPTSKKENWLSPCRYLWGPLMVYYDGKVGICCKDNDKRELIIGNLTKQTVAEVSTGEALENLRQRHLAEKRTEHPICGKCYLNSIWLR